MQAELSQSFDSLADFRELTARYRNAVVRCRSSLDQLHAAERELQKSARNLGQSVELDPFSVADVNPAELSPREFQVFTFIGLGFTSQEIASQLKIGISTVETYRERLKDKLDLRSGPSLIRCAVLWVNRNHSLNGQRQGAC